jgi:hypothetical protein
MTFFMLIQQNDGYSIAFGASEAIGAYGLFPVDYSNPILFMRADSSGILSRQEAYSYESHRIAYAQLLSARWPEIMGVIDQANY